MSRRVNWDKAKFLDEKPSRRSPSQAELDKRAKIRAEMAEADANRPQYLTDDEIKEMRALIMSHGRLSAPSARSTVGHIIRKQ